MDCLNLIILPFPFSSWGGLQSYFGYMFGECLKPYGDTFDHNSNLLLGFELGKLLTPVQTDENTTHMT